MFVGSEVVVTDGERSTNMHVLDIRRYKSVRDCLVHEGLRNILPGVETIDEGVDVYRRFSTD